MNSSLETLWHTYDTINSWIQNANTKAEIVLGIHGILVTVFLTSNLVELKKYLNAHEFIFMFLILIVLSSILSIINSIRCVNPRLDVGAPESLIFFAHIAKQFKNAPSYEGSVREFLEDDNAILHDLSSQVWANAQVAKLKFHFLTWSIRWLAATVILGVLVIIIVLVSP